MINIIGKKLEMTFEAVDGTTRNVVVPKLSAGALFRIAFILKKMDWNELSSLSQLEDGSPDQMAIVPIIYDRIDDLAEVLHKEIPQVSMDDMDWEDYIEFITQLVIANNLLNFIQKASSLIEKVAQNKA